MSRCLFLASVFLLLAVAACGGGNKHGLRVTVVTGLVPGPEFNFVTTEVISNDPPESGARTLMQDEASAAFGQAYGTGVRVASFSGVSAGEVTARVRLYRTDGSRLIERIVHFNMTTDYELTVFLTRDCVGVMCPSPSGSSALLACLGGQCVDQRCDPNNLSTRAMYCPSVTFCNTASDCGAVASCATQACIGGVCIATGAVSEDGGASSCPSDEWCDPTTGCEPLMYTPTDGGVGRSDASSVVCGTICSVPSQPCTAGAIECPDGAAPYCRALVPTTDFMDGTACGAGGVCQSGACITADGGTASVTDASMDAN